MSTNLLWYENYTVGRTIGGLLLTSGCVVLASLCLKFPQKNYLGFGMGFSGVGSVLGGIWFWRKQYRQDPVYRAKILVDWKNRNFRDGLSYYDWELILDVIPISDIQEKLLDEIGNRTGMIKIWNLYGGDILGKIIQHNLLSTNYFEVAFGIDNQDTNTPLISRLNYYGIFLVKSVGFKADTISQLIAADSATCQLSWKQLIENGAEKLFCEKMIPKTFLHDKCLEELENRKFGQFKDLYGKWWLGYGCIVEPKEVTHKVREAIFSEADVISVFKKYWHWPIEPYNTSIGLAPLEYEVLKRLYNTYVTGKNLYESSQKTVTEEYENEVQLWKRDYEIKHRKSVNRVDELEIKILTKPKNVEELKKQLQKAKEDWRHEEEELRLEKSKKILPAENKKNSSLNTLTANWTEIQTKINENWYRHNHGQPLLEINISFAGSTKPSSGGSTAAHYMDNNNQHTNVVINLTQQQQSPFQSSDYRNLYPQTDSDYRNQYPQTVYQNSPYPKAPPVESSDYTYQSEFSPEFSEYSRGVQPQYQSSGVNNGYGFQNPAGNVNGYSSQRF